MEDRKVEITRLVGSSRPSHGQAPVSLDLLHFGQAGSVEPHFHKAAHQVLLVLSGEIDIDFGSSRSAIKEGATAEIPPATPHSVSSRHGAKILVFSAPERVLGDTFEVD
jgi:mannose-6-phosphate isomerase-like protein (cupin superfamily)